MGGGGGSGTANNSGSTNVFHDSGSPGGGIIISRANLYSGSGSFVADGAPGVGVTWVSGQTDAAGGGGAGGTIIAVTYFSGTTGLGSITASAQGGTGGYMTTYYNHGPGGGGGGGHIYVYGTLASTNVSGGQHGFTRTGSPTGPITNWYNTTNGANGLVTTLTSAPLFYCGVLPVTLESFTAVSEGTQVNLNWTISNSIDFSSFEIERSSDGSDFSTIGVVRYSEGVDAYEFPDLSPLPGKNYYRLKLMDLNGKYTVSQVQWISFGGLNSNEFSVFPNPASNFINIQINTIASQTVQVSLFDNTGRLLSEKNFNVESGNNAFTMDDIKNYGTGMYFIRLNMNGSLYMQKLLIQR
jgi:hypothetical protein